MRSEQECIARRHGSGNGYARRCDEFPARQQNHRVMVSAIYGQIANRETAEPEPRENHAHVAATGASRNNSAAISNERSRAA